jgi:hypothetical protein
MMQDFNGIAQYNDKIFLFHSEAFNDYSNFNRIHILLTDKKVFKKITVTVQTKIKHSCLNKKIK